MARLVHESVEFDFPVLQIGGHRDFFVGNCSNVGGLELIEPELAPESANRIEVLRRYGDVNRAVLQPLDRGLQYRN